MKLPGLFAVQHTRSNTCRSSPNSESQGWSSNVWIFLFSRQGVNSKTGPFDVIDGNLREEFRVCLFQAPFQIADSSNRFTSVSIGASTQSEGPNPMDLPTQFFEDLLRIRNHDLWLLRRNGIGHPVEFDANGTNLPGFRWIRLRPRVQHGHVLTAHLGGPNAKPKLANFAALACSKGDTQTTWPPLQGKRILAPFGENPKYR